MRLLILPIFTGLLLFVACQKKPSEAGPEANSGEPSGEKPGVEVKNGGNGEPDKVPVQQQGHDASEQRMEETLRAKIPLGTLLPKAQAVMEKEGFRCKFMKNQVLADYSLSTRIDYLYCDRTDRSSWVSDPVVRRWQVFLVVRKGAITDVFVSTGLIGP